MQSPWAYREDERVSAGRRFVMFPVVRILIGLIIYTLLSGIVFLPFQVIAISALSVGPSPLILVLVQALAALGTLIFVGRIIERREAKAFGLDPEGLLKDLTAGAGVGTIPVAVTVGIFGIAGYYKAGPFIWQTGGNALVVLLHATTFFLLVAIGEEILFRGIAFRVAEEGLGSWGALVVTGGLFGAVHLFNPNASLLGAIGIAVAAGLLLGAAYILTRSLWLAIGIHWTWNLIQGPVIGLPVSGTGEVEYGFENLIEATTEGPVLLTGGDFGPEAGLVLIFGGAVIGVWLLVKAKRKGNLQPAPWRRESLASETELGG